MEAVMLEQYFLRPTTVDRIRSNWLGPQIEQYVEWMHAQKYAQRNITRRVALLCHFADFARANGATDHTSASSLVEKFGDAIHPGTKIQRSVVRNNGTKTAHLDRNGTLKHSMRVWQIKLTVRNAND
jgi:hypothetical protein